MWWFRHVLYTGVHSTISYWRLSDGVARLVHGDERPGIGALCQAPYLIWKENFCTTVVSCYSLEISLKTSQILSFRYSNYSMWFPREGMQKSGWEAIRSQRILLVPWRNSLKSYKAQEPRRELHMCSLEICAAVVKAQKWLFPFYSLKNWDPEKTWTFVWVIRIPVTKLGKSLCKWASVMKYYWVPV